MTVETTKDGVEAIEIKVSGLAPNTVFNVFVTQLPRTPFGLSWYPGDIKTDK